jgi:CO/xanthine dehydrogenase FAD-binding subunit
VISIVMIAGVIETDANGVVTHARIAVGSCSPVARRLCALEERLIGAAVGSVSPLIRPDDFSLLSPLDDVRASAAYRLAAAEALTRDLLAGFADAQERRAA